MEWNEFIGFIIVLFVFFIPLLRKLFIGKKKVEQKKEVVEPVYEEQEEEPQFAPPIPPKVIARSPTTQRLVKKDFEFHTEFEERAFESSIEGRTLETQEAPQFGKRIVSQTFILEKKKKRRQGGVIHLLAKKHDPLQAMVIFSEIFKKPE